MKHFTLILLFLFLPITIIAQTQHGLVKTKGRLNNDGSVIPGKMLQGVTVKVKDRTAILSNAQGEFSFPVPGSKYSLETVKKNGYQLVDPETLSRQYAYSAGNPLMIVMETPDDRADEELANERKIRRSLQRQLMQKEDEIEQLREESHITQEEYRARLQELYAQQETSEKLISKMVEYYSQIDYDQIDEFNRRISSYILNGELTRADSLLATKGDIGSRIAALKQHQAVNAEEQAELARRQQALSESEALATKEVNDLAQDCYHKYEIMKMQYRNDSAAYYIELRASLDTTNVQWQLDAGDFINKYLTKYDKAEEYFRCALRNSMTQQGENSILVAICLDKIGYICDTKGNYTDAWTYYQQALEIKKTLFGEEHIEIAKSLLNLGNVYDQRGKNDEALESYNKALEICKISQEENSDVITQIYDSMGISYYFKYDYDNALLYFTKSLEIKEKLHDDDLNPDIANSYSYLATTSQGLGYYDKASSYYSKSLNVYKIIYGKNHPTTISVTSNMGILASYMKDYKTALKYAQETVDLWKSVFGEKHPNTAKSIFNLGIAYRDMGDDNKALEYYNEAAKILTEIYGNTDPYLAMFYSFTGDIYYNNNDLDSAIKYFRQSLEIRQNIYGESHPDVAQSMVSLGQVYLATGDSDSAIGYFRDALKLFKKLYGEQHPDVAFSLANIGTVYFMQGDYGKMLEYGNKAMEIIRPFVHRLSIMPIYAPMYRSYMELIKQSDKYVDDFLNFNSEYVFTITIEDDSVGEISEYAVLEYNDWNIESLNNFFEMEEPESEKILAIKDGVISEYSLDKISSITLNVKRIGKEQKSKIITAYKTWKKEHNLK